MTLKETVLHAAKATAIPEGKSNLWRVRKFTLTKPLCVPRDDDRTVTLPPGTFTQLFKMTTATLHTENGDCVMLDTLDELKTHLDFMLRAHGHVLITGLGLGCVVRGCLANPAVKHITVVERDPDVLALVRPHLPVDPRLEIVHADAVQFTANDPRSWDCAWHDLWSDMDREDEELQITHGRLIRNLSRRVGFQGAWQFPSWMRRRLRKHQYALI